MEGHLGINQRSIENVLLYIISRIASEKGRPNIQGVVEFKP